LSISSINKTHGFVFELDEAEKVKLRGNPKQVAQLLDLDVGLVQDGNLSQPQRFIIESGGVGNAKVI